MGVPPIAGAQLCLWVVLVDVQSHSDQRYLTWIQPTPEQLDYTWCSNNYENDSKLLQRAVILLALSGLLSELHERCRLRRSQACVQALSAQAVRQYLVLLLFGACPLSDSRAGWR